MKIMLLVGLPASGKSTFAKDFLSKNYGQWKRVCRDDIRLMLDNVAFDYKNEKLVTVIENSIVIEALRAKNNVIIDATHLNPKEFVRWRKFAERQGNIQLISKNFTTTVNECIDRDRHRRRRVGEQVITDKYRKYLSGGFPPEINEYFPHLKLKDFQQDNNLPKAIICDLDGTLFDNSWRNVYDASEAERDPVIEHIAGLVFNARENNQIIFFITGRDECYYQQSFAALQKINLTPDNENIHLLMRSSGDNRRDTIIKKEHFDNFVRNKYYCLFAIDDRPSVCRMWRYEVGIPVLQVADKEF